jgi:hypothetical protein
MKRLFTAAIVALSVASYAAITTPSVTINDPSGNPVDIQLTDTPPPVGPSGSASGVMAMPPATLFEINGASVMRPRTGYDTLRIASTVLTTGTSGGLGGQFRLACATSHMGFFDPLVYPNSTGKSHLHTFFGNSDLNGFTDTGALGSSTARSTCVGGKANLSAYWVPSIINTVNGFPVVPESNIVYYKAPYAYGGQAGTTSFFPPTAITVPVPGLRMIAGSPSNTVETNTRYRWDCIHTNGSVTNTYSMPGASCENGSEIILLVYFPECWDGVNLDSPNHQAHMAYAGATTGCPATHPVPIPAISYNIHYRVNATNRPENWRLSSDTYSLATPAGRSAHGDWINGWNQTVLTGIVQNCLWAGRDAHTNLLCDGRTLF